MEPTKINNLLEEWSNYSCVYIFSQTGFFIFFLFFLNIWLERMWFEFLIYIRKKTWTWKKLCRQQIN